MSELPNEPAERRRDWRLAGIICFGLITIIILWATWLIIRPFIDAILLGAVFTTITFPTYRRVRAKLRGREGLAAFIMVMGILLLILLPAVILGMLLVQQANGVIADFQNGSAQRLLARIDIPSHPMWVRRFAPTFDPTTVSPERLLLPAVREVPGWVARNGAAIVGGVAGIALTFAMVLLSAFFFYVEGEAILKELALLS